MIKIAVDMMGGDNAPDVVLDGVKMLLDEYDDVEIQLFGDQEKYRLQHERIQFQHCTEVIDMEDEPVRAIRRKKDSSMVRMAEAVKYGEADACVSAGNTGALMSSGLFIVGRLPGVERPALALTLPTVDDSGFILLDMGANADAKPEHLEQYAVMGNVYAKAIRKIERPTIGLLNIGTEDKKGNMLTREAFTLLKAQDPLNFIGNVEAKDLLFSAADVVVTDGFTGNMVLKSLEGTANSIFTMLKQQLTKNMKNKLAAGVLKKDMNLIKDKMDYSEYGGAILFGLNGIVIKAHGSSNARAIFNALRQAKETVEMNVLETMKREVVRND
ncbi:phosphate acyltransferase PlsX [Macrococcus equipercicus]|uniref:Phosphate acyltransferase n=1 Tax=Macrococcus equipercicus TaxID=69967 RepID=A0A9Q9BUD1_9STAP|nr:phosphate acyltransferase PlsX [Macrococcus equipercicus]KAA1042768.1 phosphate acyltransferase PlsX [Macrococcus equipercicus]UTH14634.1 phosphate acyltransferase PlsX [Macrococcus equipercicus]